ncbi:MAG TPA: SMC family ATPase [Ktedonobacteraceae bacterium]|nr:SMC family ATPase [Ktedonobacteraceae bacterium]
MLVTRVELENIKSYRHLAIDFRPGTTAISGANGAGKTTIVESIGFALFDSLPYSQKLFVREGENFGKVVVHLIGNDDRAYTVERRCGSGAFWQVYDREADMRLEQRADVQSKLYELLGVERERSLKRLFDDALGVQQGRFTSNFLLTAADRKKSFDALFQIEDYKNASDYLLNTKNEYEKQLQVQEGIITRLNYETQNLNDWRQQYEVYREEEQNQHTQNTNLLQQLSAQNTRREELERQREEVTRLLREFDHAKSQQDLAAGELANARLNLEVARTAQAAVQASLPDHRAHQEAEQHLLRLREQEKQRATLRQQHADLKTNQTRYQTQNNSIEERLKEVELAKNKLIDLAPLVERQLELEGQREKLLQQESTLQSYRNEYRKFAEQHKQGEDNQEKLRQQIASIEPLQPLASLLSARTTELTELNTKLSERAVKQKALETKQRQSQQKIEDREKYTVQLQKSESNIAKIEAHRHEAETFIELQDAHNRLSEQRFRLEGNIEGYEKARQESGGGLCPFLREPCLNIQKRGENSLETYFDGLLTTDRDTLAQLVQKQAASSKRLEQIKKYVDALDRVDQYQQRRDDCQLSLQRIAEEQTQLEQELASLKQELDTLAASEQRLPSLQKACEESKQAEQQVRRLDALHSQLKQFEEQARQRLEQMHSRKQQIQELSSSSDQLAQVRQELKDLDDPRSSSREQQNTIKLEPDYQQKLQASRQRLQQIEKQLQALEQQLAVFDMLDQEIGAHEQCLRQTQTGHTTYLQNEQSARLLPEREQSHQQALQKSRGWEQKRLAAEQVYRTADAAYQPQMLEAVAAECTRLNGELRALAESMKHLQENLGKLKEMIVKAEAFLVELEAASKEKNTLDELLATLNKFRNIIKEAAPYVLKALLSDISAEANRIFGEIMGDRSSHLAWLNDYEIQINRKGVNRTFQQLSGGEQMSAALAVRLALLKKLSNLNIAFFDEPTQNMDELRRMNLAEQIRRVRGFDQLIVISHDDTFEQGLDSIVRLKKVDSETQLMSEEEVMMPKDQEQIYAS